MKTNINHTINQDITRLILLICICIPVSVFAQSKWIGRWQSEPQRMGTESLVMEYDFTTDSTLIMAFTTEELVQGIGFCKIRISVDGNYTATGPLFVTSVNKSTLHVNAEIITINKKISSSQKKELETNAAEQAKIIANQLFAGYDGVPMLYVTHENPDTISFIFGDETNAMDMVFHRVANNDILDDNLYDNDAEVKSFIDTGASECKDDSSFSLFDKSGNKYSKLFICLGIFLGYIIISFLLIRGIKYLFSRTLSRTNSANKSVRTRKIYYRVRFLVRIIIAITGLIILILFLFVAITNFKEAGKYIGAIIIFSGGGLLIRTLSSLSLPINFLTIDKFKKKQHNKGYVLYLRGFISDDYSPKMDEYSEKLTHAVPWDRTQDFKPIPDPNIGLLSERNLASAWERYYPIYSVGRPEELESPEGTIRIYLDNSSWKEDVLYLMENAKFIVVSVHPNDNCIWEIAQCNSNYAAKTAYYVDFLEKLKFIKEKMGESMPECLNVCYNEKLFSIKLIDKLIAEVDLENPNSLKDLFIHMFAHQMQGTCYVKSYKNDLGGLFETVTSVCESPND